MGSGQRTTDKKEANSVLIDLSCSKTDVATEVSGYHNLENPSPT